GNDGTRVWIDDVQVIDAWNVLGCKDSTWTSPGDGKPRRIRVESYELTNTADVQLKWTPPSSSTSVLVPGDRLAPRFGLATSAVDPDGRSTGTEFAVPESGLATKTIADPTDGDATIEEALATEVAYVAKGDG
ncbi:MAG: hypothetical protein QOG20_4401, partial [Pseudonocardiales bacterium]|nr:hypothetical protein [Pseudonocardiales bacterium]